MIPKVMVLSAGSGVGSGVIAALRMAAQPFAIVGLNSVAPAAGLFDCHAAYLTPPTAEGDRFIARLQEITAAERPAMIVPGRDADLPLLAAAKPALESMGAFVLTGSVDAAALSTDKWKQAQAFHAAGVAFAPTVADAAGVRGLAVTAGYPLIAKPRSGHSSIDVIVIRNPGDLEEAIARLPSLVVQQYLIPDEWQSDAATAPAAGLRQDDEYSIQLLLGRDAELLGLFTSRNRLEHGVPMVIEVVDDPAIETLAAAAARVLGAAGVLGPCNLQARRVGGRYVVFEVNARFTGITLVRSRMGYREVEAAFRYFVEGQGPASLLSFDRRQVAVRHLTESVFSTAALGELTRLGQWRASS